MNHDLLSRIDHRLDVWLDECVTAHRPEGFPFHLVQRVCLRRDGSLHAGWHAYPYACGGINRSAGRVPGVRLGEHRCQHQHRSPNRLGSRHPGRHGYTVACTHACPSPSQFVDLCPNTGTGTYAGKVLRSPGLPGCGQASQSAAKPVVRSASLPPRRPAHTSPRLPPSWPDARPVRTSRSKLPCGHHCEQALTQVPTPACKGDKQQVATPPGLHARGSDARPGDNWVGQCADKPASNLVSQ